MLSDIFYWVLNISIIGSVTGLVVLLLRKIKIIPKNIIFLLWFIPLLRLWIPVGLANKYSLLNLISKFTTKTVIVWQDIPKFTMTNSIMAANSYFPINFKTAMLEKFFTIASVIWIVVALAAILFTIVLYAASKKELRRATLIDDNIYKSDIVLTPTVYGVLHPKIVLPANDQITEYVIMHEQAHIKRGDNLFRIFAVITACLHWFNPLIWLFLKYFYEDMELACDHYVLRKLDSKQAKEYALNILNYSTNHSLFMSSFGGAKTKLRIENILTYKHLTISSSIYLFAILAALTIILITNAVA